MSRITHPLSQWIAMLLVGALLTVSAPAASAKPLTADTVHARVLKRGIGNWVGVKLQNGTTFAGRIVRVNQESFGLQLHNDPAITPVLYRDVVGLHFGLSNGGFLAITVVASSGVAVLSFFAQRDFSRRRTFPNPPALSTQPALP